MPRDALYNIAACLIISIFKLSFIINPSRIDRTFGENYVISNLPRIRIAIDIQGDSE